MMPLCSIDNNNGGYVCFVCNFKSKNLNSVKAISSGYECKKKPPPVRKNLCCQESGMKLNESFLFYKHVKLLIYAFLNIKNDTIDVK